MFYSCMQMFVYMNVIVYVSVYVSVYVYSRG